MIYKFTWTFAIIALLSFQTYISFVFLWVLQQNIFIRVCEWWHHLDFGVNYAFKNASEDTCKDILDSTKPHEP